MTRSNIFEILKNKYDINNEFDNIYSLSEQHIIYDVNKFEYITVEVLVDRYYFCWWKQRLYCQDTYQMKNNLDLLFPPFSVDKKIAYLEYFLNLLYLLNNFIDKKIFQITSKKIILEENINILLEHMNLQKMEFPYEEKVIVLPKDPLATSIAEISSKETAFSILKYNHYSLNGDIKQKKDILLAIANEYEVLLKNPIDGFSSYFKNATNLLNNLNIRHNNCKEGSSYYKPYIANMSSKTLEKWYDELYQLLLFCIFIKDNVERNKNIDALLKQVNLKDKENV